MGDPSRARGASEQRQQETECVNAEPGREGSEAAVFVPIAGVTVEDGGLLAGLQAGGVSVRQRLPSAAYMRSRVDEL